MTVMAYTSGYLLVFGVVMIGGRRCSCACREWLPRAAAVLSRFALAAGRRGGRDRCQLCIPYQRAPPNSAWCDRSRASPRYSATPKGYLAAAGRLHFSTWSGRFFKDPVDSFFPGVRRHRRWLAAIALRCVARRDTPRH